MIQQGAWRFQIETRDGHTSNKGGSAEEFTQDMDREQMKMAILKQEQIFRQQVLELHRLYHVQKQLMQTATAQSNPAPAIIDFKLKPQLDIWRGEKLTNPQQLVGFSSSKAPAPASAAAPAEECNLDLTLATGPSSSGGGNAERQQQQQVKRLKSSSNSDSGTTAVSSTSTDSELARFGGLDAARAVRFESESSRRMDGWMYQQCLSLKTAS